MTETVTDVNLEELLASDIPCESKAHNKQQHLDSRCQVVVGHYGGNAEWRYEIVCPPGLHQDVLLVCDGFHDDIMKSVEEKSWTIFCGDCNVDYNLEDYMFYFEKI